MFRERMSERGLEAAREVGKLAKEKGVSTAQYALLWCMTQPGVTSPIIGPRTMDHMRDFLTVLDMQMSSEEHTALDEVVHPGNAVADFHNSNPWMKARIL